MGDKNLKQRHDEVKAGLEMQVKVAEGAIERRLNEILNLFKNETGFIVTSIDFDIVNHSMAGKPNLSVITRVRINTNFGE